MTKKEKKGGDDISTGPTSGGEATRIYTHMGKQGTAARREHGCTCSGTVPEEPARRCAMH